MQRQVEGGGGGCGQWWGRILTLRLFLFGMSSKNMIPKIIKYHLLLRSSRCFITFDIYCTNDSLKARGSDNQDGTADELLSLSRKEERLTLGVLRSIDSVSLCRSDVS